MEKDDEDLVDDADAPRAINLDEMGYFCKVLVEAPT